MILLLLMLMLLIMLVMILLRVNAMHWREEEREEDGKRAKVVESLREAPPSSLGDLASEQCSLWM